MDFKSVASAVFATQACKKAADSEVGKDTTLVRKRQAEVLPVDALLDAKHTRSLESTEADF